MSALNSTVTHARAARGGVLYAIVCTLTLWACAPGPAVDVGAPSGAQTIHPELWPRGRSGVSRDAAIEARVSQLLAQMTVEEKVGQVIQPDIGSVTPDDVHRYRLGSILNGGGSGPNGNDRALAPAWLAMADAFYDASVAAPAGRPVIPLLWGSDAVHGNANIIGATIFPHNIGLGATRNPDLLRRIGEITALELRVVGGDWTFAPTIAVVRDDRWGRTYEGYSEDPRVVRQYASAIVEGIQGRPSDADFLRGPHVIATAKHFLGDGGTFEGRDQGDNRYSETELRDLFSPGYGTAISSGVQTVMASYNSWHGEKMHGYEPLLNDVLVGRFGLDGFVVGDWNGHGQVAGCTISDCAAAFNAGLDMFMAPDGWRALYDNTLRDVRSGVIPMARLDQAVGRILRVKQRAGLFEVGRPSSRQFAGDYGLLGAPAHRAVARQAVRESLVLLKNDDRILPLAPTANILVAGSGGDDMSKQTGGWTISWQGNGNSRADFPNGQTIFEAIRERVQAAGGSATFNADGQFTRRPDVAIVVFGEEPYAEFAGDVDSLDYQPGDPTDLRLLQRLREAGVPVVAVFLSGRAMYVTPEINASDAFIAAWLPGSEGGGVADLLFRNADGSAAHDFRGRLSYSWPRSPGQTNLNVGDAAYDPLFAFGYGLTYRTSRNIGTLAEASGAELAASNTSRYIEAGRAAPPWTLQLAGADGARAASDGNGGSAPGGALTVSREEIGGRGGLIAAWNGRARASLVISGAPVDIGRQANGDMSILMEVRVDTAPSAPVILDMGGRGVDVTALLRGAQGWSRIAVRLSCLQAAGADMHAVSTPLSLSTAGRMTLAIGAARWRPVKDRQHVLNAFVVWC